MESDDYKIDWNYLRSEMRKQKGGDSYRVFLESLPGLGKTTAHRFLNTDHILDLKGLLIVVNCLDLHIEDVFVSKYFDRPPETTEINDQ